MDNIPLYNSRVTRTYIEYLKANHPDVDINVILGYAGMTFYEIEDEGHWFTQKQVDRFHESLVQATGKPDIAREAGRFMASSKAGGTVRKFALGFITPTGAYSVLEKIASSINRSLTFTIRKVGANTVEVTSKPKPAVNEKPYQCENRIGTLEALTKLLTYKYPKVEHPVCIHQGGDRCQYLISWEKTPHLLWKMIRNYALMATVLASIMLFFLMPHLWWDALVLLLAILNLGIFYYSEYLEKKDLAEKIESQGDAASLLVNQINMRYNEALLVQEIGQATSKILDVDHLLKFIIEALEKRLDFDRGMIMLASKDRTRLVYTVGYGYNPEHEGYLKKTVFHLDRTESRGAAVMSFREQIPVIVNDIEEIKDQISPKSLEFARIMCAESFICVPIIYEKESMGVLMVDNVKSKRRLSQSDINLLMGIAPQIAISTKNAMSYQLIRASEERFRSLSENAPDIIYTLNTEGAFTYVNPAWERILGYEIRHVLGKYFIDFVRKDDARNYVKLFKQVRDEKRTMRDEIGILVHRDGTDRYFSLSGAPNVDSEGKVTGLVGTFKDITDLKRSQEELKKSYQKLQGTLDVTIQAISMIVEARDPYTSGHQERVARLSGAIAREMGLPEDRVTGIRMAALIHDIGKINVPAEILSKPTRLSEIEFGMIRTHPQVGYNILKTIDFPFPVEKIVLQHHERINGSGYPAGLSGDDILLEARILAVSDVVESMASHRPYRPALGIDAALVEIQQNKGICFDPGVVDACVKLFREGTFMF